MLLQDIVCLPRRDLIAACCSVLQAVISASPPLLTLAALRCSHIAEEPLLSAAILALEEDGTILRYGCGSSACFCLAQDRLQELRTHLHAGGEKSGNNQRPARSWLCSMHASISVPPLTGCLCMATCAGAADACSSSPSGTDSKSSKQMEPCIMLQRRRLCCKIPSVCEIAAYDSDSRSDKGHRPVIRCCRRVNFIAD